MTDYVFTTWSTAPEGGKRPELHGTSGSLLLAAPGHDAKWALWRVLDFDPAKNPRAILASASLRLLIESATGYPPALAIARNELTRLGVPTWAPEKIAIAYEDSLKRLMAAQPFAPFVLAERLIDEPGYGAAGEFSWILRHVPGATQYEGGSVDWVSDDFFVYTNPASDFRLTSELRKRLEATGE